MKGADPSDPRANFGACPYAEIYREDLGIADELVIADEGQLLAEYYVHFAVSEVLPEEHRSLVLGPCL